MKERMKGTKKNNKAERGQESSFRPSWLVFKNYCPTANELEEDENEEEDKDEEIRKTKERAKSEVGGWTQYSNRFFFLLFLSFP
ncbi:hypothetical protein GQ42DRAFT_30415 [Ramicandelaber brevisporus]|nr:hypothetical protein GQ42DRAFT_30415 [Ramicandelaber brevisporus]